MTEFAARTVQFVWFVTDTGELDAGELLRALLNAEPDSINRNRVPSPTTPYLSSAKRTDDQRSVTLNESPGRIDLIVQPEQPQDVGLGRPAEFDAKAVMLQFLDRFESARKFAVDGAYRIAVVCNYLEVFEQYSDVKANFFSKVGVAEVDRDVTDLIFQINKRFTFDGLKIAVNRRFTATIEMMQQVQVLGGSPALEFFSAVASVMSSSFFHSILT